jgi:hypothetical protein
VITDAAKKPIGLPLLKTLGIPDGVTLSIGGKFSYYQYQVFILVLANYFTMTLYQFKAILPTELFSYSVRMVEFQDTRLDQANILNREFSRKP